MQEPRVGNDGAVGSVPVLIWDPLQQVNPEAFAIEKMDHLLANRGGAEAGQHFCIVARGDGGQMVEQERKAGVGPRRIWSDSKGLLWVSFWNSGEIGRYDPMNKSWKVWSLPKSKGGCYAVYVDNNDKVWVTDFVANAIHRFDPATETFESFPSDKRGASVRQLLGRSGEVWGAESGVDRLVVVKD